MKTGYESSQADIFLNILNESFIIGHTLSIGLFMQMRTVKTL